MRIDRIEVERFMGYDHAVVELPERGVVVVTGPNGVGKSALTEAVGVAFYGKTIRGTPWWRQGEPGSSFVKAGDLYATRRVSKSGNKSLKWHRSGDGPEFGTQSKAQAELDQHVPPFDVWRRCSVFSSHDAALFATATDLQRKQLLEHLLGIARFDAALKLCRADLAKSRAVRDKKDARMEHLESLVEEKRRRLGEAEEGLKVSRKKTHPGALRKKLKRLEVSLDEEQEKRDAADEEVDALRSAVSKSEAELRQMRKAAEYVEGGKCVTCGQDISPEIVADLEKKITAAADALAEAEQEKHDKLRNRSNAADSARSAIAAIRAQVEQLEELLDDQDDSAERDHFKSIVESASAEISDIENELEKVTQELGEGRRQVLLLETVEQVLGIRGVRAHIIADSLAGLQSMANARLDRIFPGVEIALSPYTEKKDGGIAEAISMEVLGASGEHGYKSKSGGQRRRIDVALLLGLADVSDAAAGREPGTAWFDEVFDALDAEGVDAVSSILEEIAEQRPVVVISHNESLVESLNPSAVLDVRVTQAHKIITRAA